MVSIDYDFAFLLPGLGMGARPSGGDVVVYQLARELTARGSRCAVIGMGADREHDEPKPWRLDELLPEAYRGFDWSPFGGIDYWALRSFDYSRKTTRWLFATEFHTAVPVAGRLRAGRALFAGHLVQMHEDDFGFSGRWAPEASRALTLIPRKVVVSKELQGRFPGSRRITPGIDSARFHPDRKRDVPTVAVQIQFIPSVKGASWGLEVLREVHRKAPDVHVLAYGRQNLGHPPDWLAFVHNPTDLVLAQILAEAHVFFLPSRLEGFAVPALEALASGAFPVYTEGCGLPDDLWGTRVDFGDTYAAAAAIVGAVGQHAELRREALVEQARGFTYRKMTLEFEDAVKKLEET